MGLTGLRTSDNKVLRTFNKIITYNKPPTANAVFVDEENDNGAFVKFLDSNNFGVKALNGGTVFKMAAWGIDCKVSADGNHIIVGRVGGINPGWYFSHDGGKNWSNYTISPANTNGSGGVAISSTGQYILISNSYTSTNGGIYVSSDYGSSFSNTLPGNLGGVQGDMSDDGQYMYWARYNGVNSLYKSNNYGVNWTSCGLWYTNGVACNKTGQYVLTYCANDGMYRSINYGASFTYTGYKWFDSEPIFINSAPTNNNFWVAFAANAKKLYLSTDIGITWNLLYTFTGTYLGRACSISDSGQTIIAGSFISTNGGSTWNRLNLVSNYNVVASDMSTLVP